MGSGFTTFTAGNVLTASEVNNYLMEQSVMVFATTGARDSAITAPENGMLCYVTGTGLYYTYVTSAWISSAGEVLQTVSTFKNDIYTHSTTTTPSDITGMSVAITPRSTTNKVLITFSLAIGASSNLRAYGDLKRGSTAIAQPATGVGAKGTWNTTPGATTSLNHVTLTYLDSPATVAATTYKLTITGSGGTIYVNRDGNSADTTTVSGITAQEISA